MVWRGFEGVHQVALLSHIVIKFVFANVTKPRHHLEPIVGLHFQRRVPVAEPSARIDDGFLCQPPSLQIIVNDVHDTMIMLVDSEKLEVITDWLWRNMYCYSISMYL